jgi:hypothetical protein
VTWSGPKDLELRLRVLQVEAGGAQVGRVRRPEQLGQLRPCRLDRLLRRLDLRGQWTLWRSQQDREVCLAVSRSSCAASI